MISVGDWQWMNKRKKEVGKQEDIIIRSGALCNIITKYQI